MGVGKARNGLKIKIIIAGLLVMTVYLLYKSSIGSNVIIRSETCYFYVPEQTSISTVADTLKKRGIISSRLSLRAMATVMKTEDVKAGLYELSKGWSNYNLLKHFREHTPKPVTYITIPVTQNRKEVIRAICRGTEIHPDDVWKLLNDKKFTSELGDFNKESVFAIFIPRNYRIYKSYDAAGLLRRLYQEYLFFWNEDRLAKADEMGLTPAEVTILSSIVYAETKNQEEMPVIAGVYLNRLQKNMRLESDPTLIFAAKKFGIRRVLFKDKKIDSPYNTYKKRGLPPGPISIVHGWVIDRVLEYDGHDYLYFCAKPDLSGEHVFAETFEEHRENAQRYRAKLDEENIF